ncbi:hypothetical protein [Paenibacillus sp. MMS18-CY102]|uniref:hypothetical protein n=1 Tax=Paenibacillus sp. MMS18-CY102 TaxID=2682849 RepID=UPI001365B55A|nr:hypothetical protein [Paenibacillus sp. MMS18-CY102]MWC29638.1 hypothetical protein [Paenibacillus sp. MMS18-CY102]
MSTQFEVFPATSEVPTIVEVLQLANQKLSKFLQPYELQDVPVIHARLGDRFIAPADTVMDNVLWDVKYAWFYALPSDDGGTDAYYRKVDEDTLNIWDDYSSYGEAYFSVRQSLSVGYYWSFRRSAGQSAIINLAYGFIASALAELTNGYLFSDDGAWHGAPIRPSEFDARYFVPDIAHSYGTAAWYENCLESIVDECGGKPFELRYQLFDDTHELKPEQRLSYHPSGRLFRDGPAIDDQLLVVWSIYNGIPYLLVKCGVIAATEDTWIIQLKLLDLTYGYSVSSQPIEKVLALYDEIDFERENLTFWANPLFIKDAEAVWNQLTNLEA